MTEQGFTTTPAESPNSPMRPAAPTQPGPADYDRWLGSVRALRAEIQNLQEILAAVVQKKSLTDPAIRQRELLASLAEAARLSQGSRQRISAQLGEIKQFLLNAPALYRQVSDQIAELGNLWEQAIYHWPGAPTDPAAFDEAALLAQLDQTLQLFRRLVLQAGLLTIPDRLNQQLDQLRVGQPLDFYTTFAQELPDMDDRVAVLTFIANHPILVSHGLVDLKGGIVYNVSSSFWVRSLRWFLLLVLAIGGVFVVLAPFAFKLLTIPGAGNSSPDYGALATGYFIAVAGALFHVGVDAVKQARQKDNTRSFTALDNLLLWLIVKQWSLAIGIVLLWIAYIGFAATFSPPYGPTPFIVGYSFDSIADLFLQRFAGTSSSLLGALTGPVTDSKSSGQS